MKFGDQFLGITMNYTYIIYNLINKYYICSYKTIILHDYYQVSKFSYWYKIAHFEEPNLSLWNFAKFWIWSQFWIAERSSDRKSYFPTNLFSRAKHPHIAIPLVRWSNPFPNKSYQDSQTFHAWSPWPEEGSFSLMFLYHAREERTDHGIVVLTARGNRACRTTPIFQRRSFSKGTPLEYSSTDSCAPRHRPYLSGGIHEK